MGKNIIPIRNQLIIKLRIVSVDNMFASTDIKRKEKYIQVLGVFVTQCQ